MMCGYYFSFLCAPRATVGNFSSRLVFVGVDVTIFRFVFSFFCCQACTDTGAPIMVPVGQETLGRIMNVIGEPVDERGPINSKAKVKSKVFALSFCWGCRVEDDALLFSLSSEVLFVCISCV